MPLVLAGVAAAALLWGRNLGWPWGGGGRRGHGRPLGARPQPGGKMVFIPDVDLSEAGGNGKKAARPLFEDDAESAVGGGGGRALDRRGAVGHRGRSGAGGAARRASQLVG